MSYVFEFRSAVRTLLRTLDSWLEAKDRAYTEWVSMHDWDLPEVGAEVLAEAEAEVEVWAPRMESESVDAAEPLLFCEWCGGLVDGVCYISHSPLGVNPYVRSTFCSPACRRYAEEHDDAARI